jgi:predicted MPP superfamily phosphohydrolase
LLRREGVRLPAGINIAGVDDPAGEYMDHPPHPDEREILAKLPRRNFTLLLKHQPLEDGNAAGLFDLQLSGHVHRGQIFPFLLLVKLHYPLVEGLHRLASGAHIYVSRGSGTWGPPIRILAPPEVTILDLVYDDGNTNQDQY